MAIKSFITLLKWKDGVKKATNVIIAMNTHSWQAAGFQMGFLPQMPRAPNSLLGLPLWIITSANTVY